MSYILDALRKADAERERDPARGIHAQPSAAMPQRRAPAAQLWMLAAGAAVGVGAVAGYVLWDRPVPASVAPMAVAPAPVAPATVALASPEPARELPPPPAPAVVAVATTVRPPAPPPLPAPAPMVQRPMTRPAAVTAPAVPAAAPIPAATSGSAPAPAAAAAPASVAVPAAAPSPAPSLPAANDRILAVAELPAGVQRELPKLAISGGVYSANSAQRMLIVGAQVVNEGAELAPGVLLEQIRPKSAVLKFKGYRYSVPF